MAGRRIIATVSGIAFGILATAGTVSADVIHLKTGKKFEGLVEERGDSVVLRLERGSLTFARDDVDRIEKSPPPWEVYEQKARALKPEDAAGHLELAKWCQAGGLAQRAKKELELVIAADPENREARTLLGHTVVDGKWRTSEELAGLKPGPSPAPLPTPAPGPAPAPAPAPGPKPTSGPRVVPDGVHSGASRGFVDDVNVQVTVASGKITDVKIAGHRENRALTSLQDVPPKIVQKQGTQVDATTRATITSKAVMRAAQSALDSSAPVKLAEVPDGKYSGTCRGTWADLTVEVEVKGGRIVSAAVTNSREPPKNAQAQQALTAIPKLIVDQQSTAVQPVAGGEVTSRSIMRAAQAALDSAVPRVLQPK